MLLVVDLISFLYNIIMPLPTPQSQEPRGKFMSRCMSDSVMAKEFPDAKQRAAVCYSQSQKKKKKKK